MLPYKAGARRVSSSLLHMQAKKKWLPVGCWFAQQRKSLDEGGAHTDKQKQQLRLLISRCARLARLCHLHSHRSSVASALFFLPPACANICETRSLREAFIHVCACGSLGGRLRVERALTARSPVCLVCIHCNGLSIYMLRCANPLFFACCLWLLLPFPSRMPIFLR